MDRFLPAIAAALTASVLAAFAWSAASGLWRPDAFDYAQIARELAAGNGFESRQAIYLLHLEFLDQHGLLGEAWPSLHRFPLPSRAIAAGFGLFGVSASVVIGYGIAFHALTSALVFAWAREASGLAAAIASSALVTINAAMLETAPSGLAEPPVIFFFTLSLYWLWRLPAPERSPRAHGMAIAAGSGAALGLAALARTNALFSAPVLLLAVLARRDNGRKQAAVWLLALCAVLTPWLVRNAMVAGDPFFSLHSYFLLPAGTQPDGLKWDLTQRWVREFVPPLEYGLAHPAAVFQKWTRNLGRLATEFPTLTGTFGLPLVALTALLPAGRELRTPAVVLFGCFMLNAVFVSLTDTYFDKYHFQFLPGFILLATALLWRMLARVQLPWLRASAFAALVLAIGNPRAALSAGDRIRAQTARFSSGQLAWVAAHTSADAIVLSDHSYAVTWATGRRTIRTHYDRLADGSPILGAVWLDQHYLPIDAIYLSAEFTRGIGRGETLRNTLTRDPRFRATWPEVHRFEDGALFFSRVRPTSMP